MQAFKTFFWTTLFWFLVLFIISLYAKYARGGDQFAAKIATMLGVQTVAEEAVATDTNDPAMVVLQEMVADIHSDVKKLVSEKDMNDVTVDTDTGTGSVASTNTTKEETDQTTASDEKPKTDSTIKEEAETNKSEEKKDTETSTEEEKSE